MAGARRVPVLRSQTMVLHGHEVAYRAGGNGPVIVAIAGITGAADHWDRVFAPLTTKYTVISPDLFGYETGTRKHDGDYSLRAQAVAIRDLLMATGHKRATLVGHSLGGGVCVALASQFPELVERVVLVSSGGLGSEVHPILRFASLPGAGALGAALGAFRLPWLVRRAAGALESSGLTAPTDLREIGHGVVLASENRSRAAFIDAVRSVIDHRGQRLSAASVLYLLEQWPTMIVWGERDSIIPVAHAHEAHRRVRTSRLEVIPDAGHFPHIDCPDRVTALIDDFLSTTEPAQLTLADFERVLLNGGTSASAI